PEGPARAPGHDHRRAGPGLRRPDQHPPARHGRAPLRPHHDPLAGAKARRGDPDGASGASPPGPGRLPGGPLPPSHGGGVMRTLTYLLVHQWKGALVHLLSSGARILGGLLGTAYIFYMIGNSLFLMVGMHNRRLPVQPEIPHVYLQGGVLFALAVPAYMTF